MGNNPFDDEAGTFYVLVDDEEQMAGDERLREVQLATD
jgi:hypothetical protein